MKLSGTIAADEGIPLVRDSRTGATCASRPAACCDPPPVYPATTDLLQQQHNRTGSTATTGTNPTAMQNRTGSPTTTTHYRMVKT